ncbi:MAG: arsenic resistance N-acetyltransferase ArsN2 [Balneolaceae bacterium]
MSLQINVASEEDLGSIIRLLSEYDLPTQDIGDSDIEFYVVKKGRDLVACVGLEIIEDTALLRSLAIEKESAHQGIGTQLVKFILDESSVKQLKSIFLLTETAASFFTKLGFKTIERNSAPEAMQRSTEFSELCAETAVCMKIDL